MTDEKTIHDYASIASTAYMRNKNDRVKFLEKQGLKLTVDNDLTDKYGSVFYDDNNIYYSIRGTDINNKQGGRNFDLLADSLLFFGLENISGRYKQAERRIKALQDKYKDKKIKLIGHSLGGLLSQELSRKYSLEAHAFNPGTSYIHTQRNKYKYIYDNEAFKKQKNNITSYIVGGDAISNFGLIDPSVKVQYVRQKSKGAHDIQNFYL